MLTNYQKSLIILNPIIYELYDMIVIDFSWQIMPLLVMKYQINLIIFMVSRNIVKLKFQFYIFFPVYRLSSSLSNHGIQPNVLQMSNVFVLTIITLPCCFSPVMYKYRKVPNVRHLRIYAPCLYASLSYTFFAPFHSLLSICTIFYPIFPNF